MAREGNPGRDQNPYLLCGKVGNTEIMRYRRPDIAKSGVVSTFRGGLLTARHVVQHQGIPGFTLHSEPQMDIAYKLDAQVQGLPLGWVDEWAIEGVDLVTTSLEDPTQLVTIPGRVGLYLLPTDLQPFHARSRDQARTYFKPGLSGSPLIYKDHIIGIVPFKNNADSDEVVSVVFNGEDMKTKMEAFGLPLNRIT